MAKVPMVTERDFEAEVLRTELPVLVEFGAEWCGPCKIVAPELEALAQEMAGRAKVLQVDIDRSPMLAQALRIQSVPTFVVFNRGQPVAIEQGAVKRQRLRELLAPHLPRSVGAVSPKEAAKLLELRRVTMVDTRAPEAFRHAHIAGAVSFPLETLEARAAELGLLPTPPVLYCRTGKETEALAARLAELGSPVAFLEGGVLGWESEGYRLERP
jgi:thioredoxin 1/putative thioredoxin